MVPFFIRGWGEKRYFFERVRGRGYVSEAQKPGFSHNTLNISTVIARGGWVELSYWLIVVTPRGNLFGRQKARGKRGRGVYSNPKKGN